MLSALTVIIDAATTQPTAGLASFDTWTAIATIVSAFLTPVIALAVVYVAWQQHKTARDKLRLNLFDRRMKVYEAVVRCLSEASTFKTVSDVAKRDLARATGESRFLFGEEIRPYVGEVLDHVEQFNMAKAKTPRALESPDDRAKVASELDPLVVWFHENYTKAVELFAPYLQFAIKSGK